jgi:peptidoglycan hydrolase CwlO-like protein
VKKNNHLPGIKSAAAIKEQGFWDLGEASRLNLEKIEELFLHTIEQEKKIKELKSSNKNMASEVEALKAQMEEIKKLLLEKTKE